MEARRRRHETKKAAMMQAAYQPTESADDATQSLIFKAISKLSTTDQSAVVLRYFQDRTIGEVAQSLAISEEAARKRLSRALDKLHSFLESYGINNAQDALALSLTPGLSIPAPQAALAKSIVNIALLSHSTANQGAAAMNIANQVSRMITFTHQLKLAGMAAGVLLVVAVAAGPLLQKSASTAPTTAPTATVIPAAQDTPGEFTVVVSNDISIHILGVSPFNGDASSWFGADGNPIQAPKTKLLTSNFHIDPPPTHQIVLQIDKPREVTLRSQIVGTHGGINWMGEFSLVTFVASPAQQTATLRTLIADGDWQTIVTNEKPQEAGDFKVQGYGTFSFQPVTEEAMPAMKFGRAASHAKSPTVTFTSPSMPQVPMKVVVVDDAGQQHENSGNASMSNGTLVQLTHRFADVPLAKIKKVLVMVRPFTKVVEISDISLTAGQITKPQVKITDAPPPAAGNLDPSGL
jgi:hypothetical protein